MNTPVEVEHCLSFIHCQLQPPDKPVVISETGIPKRAVTISRQSGCGAHVVAEKLAQRLQSHTPAPAPPWTVFDRNLAAKILADHQLPERFARFMPEDRVLEIDDIIDEVFGLHPSSWTLIEQTADTILQLASRGNVIILGRGANLITARLPHVLHVRMIASFERRVEHMQRFEGLGAKEAAERIRREDLGRERYLWKHFGKDIDDPLLYHLIINTDLVSLDDAARLIGDLLVNRAVPATA